MTVLVVRRMPVFSSCLLCAHGVPPTSCPLFHSSSLSLFLSAACQCRLSSPTPWPSPLISFSSPLLSLLSFSSPLLSSHLLLVSSPLSSDSSPFLSSPLHSSPDRQSTRLN